MAEEIYFIKTNPNIAKINLFNKLCREEDTVLDFLDKDQKTSFEIIKNKVKDNIENLTAEEFRSIFHWFESKYRDHSNNKEEVISQLFIHGIDQFYQIPATDSDNFNRILSDYQNYSQNTLQYKFNAEAFSPFLIYGIFLTGLANQQQKKDEANVLLMDFLKPDYKKLYAFAEEVFNTNFKDSETAPVSYNYFTELYDLTRFYKDPMIKVQD